MDSASVYKTRHWLGYGSIISSDCADYPKIDMSIHGDTLLYEPPIFD